MINPVEIFPLLFTFSALLGGFLIARKNSWGWIAYGIANLMLLMYGAIQGSEGFIISPFLFWIMNFYGLWKWNQPKKWCSCKVCGYLFREPMKKEWNEWYCPGCNGIYKRDQYIIKGE